MGQTLSEPITTKHTTSCANGRYSVGSSSMQGWRINMEDAHIHLLQMPTDASASFFAVYDGHGGARIARYASQNLHHKIGESEPYLEGRISEALIEGFLGLDEKMRGSNELKEEMSGSTAIVVLIKDNFIYCANAGDSRAVVSVAGRAVPLSTDHKPCNEEESRRIFAAGGWVEFNRVNGNLALSRAFGDFAFKSNEELSARDQIVTACPEVETHAITAEHEFIVLACDGIWDVMSNQEVVDFCRQNIAAGFSPDRICEELIDKCLAPDCELSGLGCDNMTVILVCLLQDRTQQEYMQQLQKEAAKIDPTAQQQSDYNVQHSLQSSARIPAYGAEHEGEPVEDIFSTPSHSPPLSSAMMGEAADLSGEKVTSTETSDEDLPPNEFKVCEEDARDQQDLLEKNAEEAAAIGGDHSKTNEGEEDGSQIGPGREDAR